MKDYLQQIIDIAKQYPEVTGTAVGVTGGSALTWFANKFLEKKRRISPIAGAMAGAFIGRVGGEVYSKTHERPRLKNMILEEITKEREQSGKGKPIEVKKEKA